MVQEGQKLRGPSALVFALITATKCLSRGGATRLFLGDSPTTVGGIDGDSTRKGPQRIGIVRLPLGSLI